MNVLCHHCRNQISNIYQGNSTPAEAIIYKLGQEVEFQDLFCTIDEIVKELNDQAKKQGQQKVLNGELDHRSKESIL